MEKLPQQTTRYKLMRELVGNVFDKILLDVGAGYMPISRGIKTKKTIRLDGVKTYNPDVCCDINNGISLKDNSIDIIVAGEIIEHIFNPIRFIRECNRVLKKDGILILSTPNVCSLTNRFKVFLGQLPQYCAEPLDDESFERHIVDFNFPSVVKILKENGFRIEKRTSNGIISHNKLLFPKFLTPAIFGQAIIVRAKKEFKVKEYN